MQNYILTNNLINNIKLLLFAKTSEENQENHKKIPSKESERSYRYLANNLSIKELVSSFSKINNRQREAKNIIIRGHFNGSIKTKQLQICNSAILTGKISYEQIKVEDGASVEGNFIKI